MFFLSCYSNIKLVYFVNWYFKLISFRVIIIINVSDDVFKFDVFIILDVVYIVVKINKKCYFLSMIFCYRCCIIYK